MLTMSTLSRSREDFSAGTEKLRSPNYLRRRRRVPAILVPSVQTTFLFHPIESTALQFPVPAPIPAQHQKIIREISFLP